jgi:hypothetical protein
VVDCIAARGSASTQTNIILTQGIVVKQVPVCNKILNLKLLFLRLCIIRMLAQSILTIQPLFWEIEMVGRQLMGTGSKEVTPKDQVMSQHGMLPLRIHWQDTRIYLIMLR